MTINIDCVKLKNDIQEQIYNSINPVNVDDYFTKMNNLLLKNKLYERMKNKVILSENWKRKLDKHTP